MKLEKVNIEIGEEEFTLDPEDLSCSEETINVDLMNQPSLYTWISVLKEEADAEYQEKKMSLDLMEAELDSKYRKKTEKPTENKIAMAIIRDDDYGGSKTEMIQARRNVGILRAWEEGFRQRKEVLIALASNFRAQMDVDLHINRESKRKKIRSGD